MILKQSTGVSKILIIQMMSVIFDFVLRSIRNVWSVFDRYVCYWKETS